MGYWSQWKTDYWKKFTQYTCPDISRTEMAGEQENEPTWAWDLYSLGCIA
ncbi:hypothetical protein Pmar_PMAR024515 [Perkinsus marinus ATCC 50983]|uniref:Uncharacterized protein n=1 Tax=Perkinsus marinus (strain ATCC 50983 / TXsc) TaxID=423536 RepID=C5LT71_PERM5|nr:hypothetical protein Pmar_PMAR024515 [Perkinsus marinus ATCC 50983]EER00039.1 hypothetical protein Pmar_PMAR024515 [Perkinsus marinus ATCC 50983]|eukprot:XP_002767321.1 hypothetical protein Pmar_PMAR024515 [Perkinsus marinus ATCC 50983]